MTLDGEAQQLYPHSWRILSLWESATRVSPGYAAFNSSRHQLSGIAPEDVTEALNLVLRASGCDTAEVARRPRLLSDNGASYAGEDYHQDYFVNNPQQPYCQAVVAPKVAKARQKYAHLLA